MREYNPKQCHNCQHYESNYDPSVGMFGQPQCDAVPGGDDATEQVAIVLENILFALSDINNCPMWKDKASARRSITQVNKPKPGDDNYQPAF